MRTATNLAFVTGQQRFPLAASGHALTVANPYSRARCLLSVLRPAVLGL